MSFTQDVLFSIRTHQMDEIIRTPHLLEMAREMTLYRPSGMNNALDYYTDLAPVRHIEAQGIFAFYSGESIGWALNTAEDDKFSFCAREGHTCTQIYIKEGFRRRGVGSALLRAVVDSSPSRIIHVYSWSNPDFFTPFVVDNQVQPI